MFSYFGDIPETVNLIQTPSYSPLCSNTTVGLIDLERHRHGKLNNTVVEDLENLIFLYLR